MKKLIIFTIVVLFSLSCIEQEVKVGVALPLSGDQVVLGRALLQGVELAAEEWNRRGGALRKKITLVVMDDEADPSKAKEVAKRLVDEKVIGVIGHMNSDCSIQASDIYARAEIPMISPSSTSPALTDRNLRNIFRICGRDDAQMMVASDFICGYLKPEKVFLIHDRSIYGENLVKTLKGLIGKSIQIIGEGTVNSGDTTFPGLIEEVKSLNPELVFFGGVDPEAGHLVRQMRKSGIKSQFMGGDGLASNGYLKIAGASAEGSFFTFGLPIEQLGSAAHFVRVFKEKFGVLSNYAVYAYDAFNVLLEAYCASQGKSLIETLHKSNFDGAIGFISFDSKGDMIRAPYMVWTVKNGKMTPWVTGY
ncbi:MAG: branched-chain amino acid ABC transporter substrate-binding protein [candidate division WOR-3 bacterium]